MAVHVVVAIVLAAIQLNIYRVFASYYRLVERPRLEHTAVACSTYQPIVRQKPELCDLVRVSMVGTSTVEVYFSSDGSRTTVSSTNGREERTEMVDRAGEIALLLPWAAVLLYVIGFARRGVRTGAGVFRAPLDALERLILVYVVPMILASMIALWR